MLLFAATLVHSALPLSYSFTAGKLMQPVTDIAR